MSTSASPLGIAVVGAGVHGSVVAVHLLAASPELRSSLRLIDPAGTCLAEWSERSWGQGMEWMRSPGAHHLDVAPTSLLDFARTRGRETELAEPYSRPSLQLFMNHARSVIDRVRLDELVIPTSVVRVEPDRDGFTLECADGITRRAGALVLAPGLRRHARFPAWAASLAGVAPGVVTHAEYLDLRREDLVGRRLLVVGGGLSAATIADVAVRRGAWVTLVSRHPHEVRLFDADPGWLGPKYLRAFQREPAAELRAAMIRRARGRGSITPELAAALDRHVAERGLERRLEDDVLAVRVRAGDGLVALRFATDPTREHRAERVICATGFAPHIADLAWLGELAHGPQHDGRPLVGPTLEVAPRCFVTGWLAELWVGPAARNIAGARHAAGLIAAALAQGRRAGVALDRVGGMPAPVAVA